MKDMNTFYIQIVEKLLQVIEEEKNNSTIIALLPNRKKGEGRNDDPGNSSLLLFCDETFIGVSRGGKSKQTRA